MCEVEVLASGVRETLLNSLSSAPISWCCRSFFSFLGPRLEHEIHHIKNDTTGKGFLSQYYLF